MIIPTRRTDSDPYHNHHNTFTNSLYSNQNSITIMEMRRGSISL
jgi:hypothetical protein